MLYDGVMRKILVFSYLVANLMLKICQVGGYANLCTQFSKGQTVLFVLVFTDLC